MSHTEKEQERRSSSSGNMPTVWVVDASPNLGQRNSRIGIAQKLNPEFEVKKPREVLEILSSKKSVKLPDIIIGTHQCGVLERIGKISNKNTLTISAGCKGADLNFLSGHITNTHFADSKDVKLTVGVPHAVTKEKIEAGKKDWDGQFSGLPYPRIGVLVGGKCDGLDFTPEMAREMANKLVAKAKELGGSLITTTSKRTGAEATEAFMNVIEKEKHIPTYLHDWRLDAAKGNPYFGVLGLADAIIVAGDSMSMCCEANMSRKPVYIYAPEGTRKDDARLHQQLYDRNLAKPFADFIEKGIEPWKYEPLDTAGDIAKEALKQWQDRQKSRSLP